MLILLFLFYGEINMIIFFQTLQIELVNESSIRVNQMKLYNIYRTCRHDEREMIREVYRLIYSNEELAKFSATGKTHPKVPETVYISVERNFYSFFFTQ